MRNLYSYRRNREFFKNKPSSRNPIEISHSNISDLIESARIPKDPLEAIDRIILYIYKKSINKTYDSFITITANDYPIVYAKNQTESRTIPFTETRVSPL